MKQKRTGLALSGGGYRAAGFHLGTLRKLKELEVLDKIDVLSTISGGSITGAAYCLHQGDYEAFETHMLNALATKNVLSYIFRSWTFIRFLLLALLFVGLSVYLSFTRFAPLSILPIAVLIYILISRQFSIFPVSKVIEKAYDEFFYNKKVLIELCEKPLLAIGSTNINTGRHFTFSRIKMSDSTYEFALPPIKFRHENFPVARAVIASSCVPFAFTPITIAREFYVNPPDSERINPRMIDGGVYDNQGVHKLTQDNSTYACDTVIVSDAGNKMPFEKLVNNTIVLLIRTVDIFMQRIKDFQMISNIYENVGKREVAYLTLGWDVDKCIPGFIQNLKDKKINQSVIAAHQIPDAWSDAPDQFHSQLTTLLERNTNYPLIKDRDLPAADLAAIRGIGTNLTSLDMSLLKRMITHAGNLTELQVRLYCPSLVAPLVLPPAPSILSVPPASPVS